MKKSRSHHSSFKLEDVKVALAMPHCRMTVSEVRVRQAEGQVDVTGIEFSPLNFCRNSNLDVVVMTTAMKRVNAIRKAARNRVRIGGWQDLHQQQLRP